MSFTKIRTDINVGCVRARCIPTVTSFVPKAKMTEGAKEVTVGMHRAPTHQNVRNTEIVFFSVFKK